MKTGKIDNEDMQHASEHVAEEFNGFGPYFDRGDESVNAELAFAAGLARGMSLLANATRYPTQPEADRYARIYTAVASAMLGSQDSRIH